MVWRASPHRQRRASVRLTSLSNENLRGLPSRPKHVSPMPLQRGAVRRNCFAPGNLHPPAVEAGTVHLKFAAVRARHEGTDGDGRRYPR
jgi:hypothetical protein